MPEKESPFAALEPTEKGARSADRIKERFNVSWIPEGLLVLAASETGINDVYMNLNRQLGDGKVEERTKLLIAVGVSAAVGSAPLVNFFTDAAIAIGRTAEEALDAVSVALVASIFNGYYRFRHQVPDSMRGAYEAFRAPFNANTLAKSALSQVEVESIAVAVSSINNCHMCVEGHLNKAAELGLNEEQIDEIIKTAAASFAVALATAALTPPRAAG